jgi:hypothetical protein
MFRRSASLDRRRTEEHTGTVRRRLIVVLLSAGVASVPAAAHATVTPLAPADGASFRARPVSPPIFRVSATPPSGYNYVTFHVSQSAQTDSDGILYGSSFSSAEKQDEPGVYQTTPSGNDPFPKTPATYYWQASYSGCYSDPAGCKGPIRTLTVEPLPAPDALGPQDGASIPLNGSGLFSIKTPLYAKDGTTILYIEFARGNRIDPDGTFADADSMFRAQPASSGGDGSEFEYTFGWPWSGYAGTYYWMPQRYDCYAEPDCMVTGQVRRFSVDPPSPATPGTQPSPGAGSTTSFGPTRECRDARAAVKRARRRVRSYSARVRNAKSASARKRYRRRLARARRNLRRAQRDASAAC